MDTARADAVDSVGPIGSSWLSTETGTHFNRAYASAPWTLPSHGSLFTGTAPSNHGAHAGHKRLEASQTTLAELLSNEGYETVAVSNNTWISEEFGFGRGFETFYKTWQYIQSDTDLGRIARQEEGIKKLTKAVRALFDGNPATNLANAIYGQFFRKADDDGAAQTNEWIDDWLTARDDSRPFFLFVNYLEPHLEYRPPIEHAQQYLPDSVSYDEAIDVSQDPWKYIAGQVELSQEDFDVLRALYRAEISYLLEKINAVVEMLKAAGEWDDTLFIVTSDHGENIGDHGLMDHQYALYDTLLHVPLFIKGEPFDGDERDEIVQLTDIPPTVLDVLDIDAPAAREQFQGISLHPDSSETREFATAEYMTPQPSMDALEKRIDDLPDSVLEYDRSLRAIRTDQHKYIRGSDGSQRLYDVQSDSNETADIAERNPDLVERLDTEIDEWLESFEHADTTGTVSMDAETRDRLEDLGYLQ